MSQGRGVTVVTYNVLSPNLCQARDFYKCDKKALQKGVRYAAVLKKLKSYVERGAIICLQEVPEDWTGKLYTWFSSLSYRMIASNYANDYSGYMGIATAFPASLAVLTSTIVRPTRVQLKYEDRQAMARSRNKSSPGMPVMVTLATLGLISLNASKVRHSSWATAALTTGVFAVLGIGHYLLGRKQPKKVWPLESKLRSSFNTAIFMRFRDPRGKRPICVANYHFPCKFRDEEWMTAIGVLLTEKIHRLAKNDPLVIAGDFNSKPGSTVYNLLTTGRPTGSVIPSRNYEQMQISGKNVFPLKSPPLRSAYKEASAAADRDGDEKGGSEPSYTNFARRLFKGVQNDFCDTIDYIFISKDWSVLSVRELPDKDETLSTVDSYPTLEEPSDHLLLAATLTLARKKGKEKKAPASADSQ